ncbi:MAG TPA: hypothetical protein VGK46_11925 [Saprospiraceae bacterium]
MKSIVSILGLASLMFLSACSPTMKITGNWMNKEVMGTGKFQKIFLFAIAYNMGAKQSVENAQAKAATDAGINVVKSYEVFGPNFLAQKPSKDEILAKIRETGCDAVFTTALVDEQSETRYVPGTTTYTPYYGYYGSFGGYYGSMNSYMYEPGYYTEDKTYFFESNLYDVESGDIVWSVQSEAYNPTNVDKVARDYSYLLFEKLKSEGILNKKP